MWFFFFFQAEDGIRDLTVTGVQTCALPISNGLLYGEPGQLWKQFVAVVATIVLGFVMTFVILKVLDAIMGLRVTEDDEMAGLDLSQHSETAYALGGSSYGEYGMSGPGTGAFAEAMKAAQAKRPAH